MRGAQNATKELEGRLSKHLHIGCKQSLKLCHTLGDSCIVLKQAATTGCLRSPTSPAVSAVTRQLQGVTHLYAP